MQETFYHSGQQGHKQPATPIITDNNTASGIINGIFKQYRSKAIDMRFYWLGDRFKQGQFKVYWESGKKNLADSFTKKKNIQDHIIED